ncbi:MULTISPECIES: Co2+/Mg2+ efflux protein ApaG [Shewanella]|uniref:Protein ApaG n=1 Tax=Shewanella japonica TaxID=93973 RepID=A0ABM6JGW0_9GAMM|nr:MULTISPECIES: Co2+/Mg2+ efflux protein ApaG [Shewanella]ARD21434.1 Co2+/Mg2+ efflux protein ApaG [Shewanella japonica]MBQ4888767.1 Co2+/Mg2+ efflux protein ApaG [Shewanella sp. MMG014]OBT08907.1 Co2+/Mg2+ efflux protein ApaG [Shewanella sp. UCD-FRSSP16_17]
MTSVASNVKIKVETKYLEDQSSAEDEKYLFSYTITIINLSEIAVTLKDRHWIITNANGETSEVKGPGVVGETPTIDPDTAYQYSSGTVMETPVGFMEGSYGMVTDQGESFSAQIPTFRLAVPGIFQ